MCVCVCECMCVCMHPCVHVCVCVYLMIQRQSLLLLSEVPDELNEPLGPFSTNCPSHVAIEIMMMLQ